jgi:hypothetical protein
MNWTGTSSLASGTLSLTTAPTASAIFDAGDDTATLAQTGTIASPRAMTAPSTSMSIPREPTAVRSSTARTPCRSASPRWEPPPA